MIFRLNNPDYARKLFVVLSDDKSRVISYPAPTDLYTNGKISIPTKLTSKYYLDNRGVDKNSVVLNIELEDYAKREKAFSLGEMYSLILDKNPFLELYHCGNRLRFKNELIDLKELIKNGGLKQCQCLIGR